MSTNPNSIMESLDPDVTARLVTRRHAIMRGGTSSAVVLAGLRMASVPMALPALARDAFGQSRLPAAVSGVLNFALKLEYLEAEFYNRGVAASGLIPAADLVISRQFRRMRMRTSATCKVHLVPPRDPSRRSTTALEMGLARAHSRTCSPTTIRSRP